MAHAVQADSDCRDTPGGRGRKGSGRGLPRSSSRRDMVACVDMSFQCPAGPGGPDTSWYIHTKKP